MKIVIVPNTSKLKWQEYLIKLIDMLQKNNVNIYVYKEFEKYLSSCPGLIFDEKENCFSNADIIISAGGDGTLLHTAKYAAKYDLPVLGINTGNLGYMVELEISDLKELERLFSGEYKIDKRMMLEASVITDGMEKKRTLVLNDVCVSRGTQMRMLELDIYADNCYINSYRADGLIISTPTGSTAYSLSAGGPVVEPQTETIGIIPICPHTLAARPIILSSDRLVNVSVKNLDNRDAQLACDGEIISELLPGDIVSIKKSGCFLKLIRLKNRGFYDILRQKLNERGN